MINVDPRSSTPIYEQIINEVKTSILKGMLVPGDKLPSVRQLSKNLIVNPNTVSKAYMELERQKVIQTLKGRGTYVSMDYNPTKEATKINIMKNNLKNIVVEAHYIGIGKQELIGIIETIYNEIGGSHSC
ncbi:GntR family transcriptional regulator [Vallitalea pronyensis]|uniref:GntR family transcriptional regulator n=1 Tax=Vallitalea pronyensis TaxID=1348613 RepID=A0A8J8MMJ5_9FIRM|nr:GntR family transcriptional regulator [Vallitalea pronyensis]QUI24435.1 GntR family transcriptional regulator [Vallitalea pronyensis]